MCLYAQTAGDRRLWFLGAPLFLITAMQSGRQAALAYHLRKGRPDRWSGRRDAALYFLSAAVCWPLYTDGLRWFDGALALLCLSAAALQIGRGAGKMKNLYS